MNSGFLPVLSLDQGKPALSRGCRSSASIAISSLSSRSPSVPAASMFFNIWRTASTIASKAVVISGVRFSRPSRSRASRVSPKRVRLSRAG